eukprot:15354096-Ditylum_brightwellii.AAC.1
MDSSILTSAVQHVVQSCPSKLKWKPIEILPREINACFEARGKDGCIYCINVYSGIVLVDGMPPDRLPADILNHRLYIRTFGKRNFEVVKKNGMLETVQP